MIAINEEFVKTASLIGEPVRATILWTLLDGRSMTASELAIAAETSASNISMHLAKLVQAEILKADHQGRHRYFSFARKDVAYVIEAIASINGSAIKVYSSVLPVNQVRQCRTCYDHLAGKTGVALTDALINKKIIKSKDQVFELTMKGKKWFADLEIDTTELQRMRRSFLRPCLDWSERRYHMAGSLAAALLDKMIAEDWIRKTRNSRAAVVTSKGQKALYEKLKLSL